MSGSGRSTPLLLLVLIALTATGAAASLIVLYDQVEHLVLFILVPLMFLIGAVPIAVGVWRRTFDLCEITVPYFVLYFLFYGVGAFCILYVRDVAYDSGVRLYLDAAVALCTLGFACLMLGYALAGRLVRPLEPGPGPHLGAATTALIYGIGYVGLVVYAILGQSPAHLGGIVSGFTSLITQLSFLSTFSVFYATYLVMTRRGGATFRFLLFAVMVPTQLVALFLFIGNKSFFILTLGIPIIAFWYTRRRVPWKSILAATLLVVFVIFPLYYQYRNIRGVYVSHEARVQKSIKEVTGGSRGEYAEDALDTVARRIAIVNSTAVILRECGRTVEYQGGGTLWLGIISIAIPRFLWPNKPSTMIGTDFGKTFRITGALNYSAISLSTVGELYWNFQVPGVVIGMFVLGMCMRVLYLRFGFNGGSNPVRLAMYVTLLYAFLLMIEGSIGGLQGVLVKQILMFLALEKVLQISAAIGARRAIPRTLGDAVTVR